MIEYPKLMNANESQPIRPHFHMDRDWLPTVRAEFAKELAHSALHASTWGKCHKDYQEVRNLTPREVVVRACDIADAFYTEIESRGWLLSVPVYDDCVKTLRDTAPSPVGFASKTVAG